MKGERVYPGEELGLKPGQYASWKGQWFVCTPNGLLGNVSKHSIEEHEDGTITVSPSILVTHRGRPDLPTYHGFLRRGIWTEA